VIYCFPKSLRLCKRSDYQRLFSFEARYVGRFVTLELRSNQFKLTRLGITVSRRYGKAVLRNRFKRIVREAFRLSKHQLVVGFDINIRPRTASISAKPKDIQEDFIRFLTKVEQKPK
jgi:ribonuclease P protein component